MQLKENCREQIDFYNKHRVIMQDYRFASVSKLLRSVRFGQALTTMQ